MLVRGNLDSDRLNILSEKCAEFYAKLTGNEELYILVANSGQKVKFNESLKEKIGEYESSRLKILTFQGLCYNAVKDNEDYVKSLIKCDKDETLNLSGLEVSQFIFSQCIKENDFSDYISKVNLLHQLFRRYSLIVQNRLDDKEIFERSKILKESFYKEAQKAIEDYKLKTIKYRSFDYLRQSAIFPLIYENTSYFDNIKYLILDDADEASYALWQFIEHILSNLKEYAIGYDQNGSSRCGYLCAYKNGVDTFKKKYSPDEIIANEKENSVAEEFFEKIKSGNKIKLENTKILSFTTRTEMLIKVFEDIKKLTDKGIKPDEISVVSPVVNDFVKEMSENNDFGLKFQIVSGGEKLSQNKTAGNIITILKIINGIKLKEFEASGILTGLLKIPYKNCFPVIREFEKTHKFNEFEFNIPLYDDRYTKFVNVINSVNNKTVSVSEQIKILYENLFRNNDDYDDKEKYLFLHKEAESFEKAFSSDIEDLTKKFIIQIENSIISENPAEAFKKTKNGIIIATPQKIIDNKIKTKYSFWIDFSSSEWFKQDTGTLYNAWVFGRDRGIGEYSFEENALLTRDKTARIIRKLFYLSEELPFFFSSIYSETGYENFSGPDTYCESKNNTKPVFKIIPRDDQKAVLEYKSGETAVMAVPGAGKTTVLLALIIKLIESGIKTENIFVLTYMESAAKNFKERIKSALKENSELPNISTIHGLALRILKENAHYELLGLDENFEICDDNIKDQIIKELFFKFKVPEDKQENYIKCISTVKPLLDGEVPHTKFKEPNDFFIFLKEYNKVLKSRNLIDYDDMLGFAIKLLRENNSILNYYKDLCKYIIEDEAQDSTEAQQRLISLLKSKHNNYLRCGDFNQSITSTFTGSDLQSFRNFINEHTKTEMSFSQRCSKTVYECANNLVKYALNNPQSKDAFYDIEMNGTDKNPASYEPPVYRTFQTQKEERDFILNKIKEIKSKKQGASVAILLRLNSQVNEYNEFLIQNNIETETASDCLIQNSLFKIVSAVLILLYSPFDKNNLLKVANIYTERNIKTFTEQDKEFLKSLNNPLNFHSFEEISEQSENIQQLFWDLDFFSNLLHKNIGDIALKIALFYARTVEEKSNAYITASFFKRFDNQNKKTEEILKNCSYYAEKPLTSFKPFNEKNTENKVKIMTIHKSKGDEFDFVFIPELNEENFPLTIKSAKLKSGGHFVRTVKNIVDKSGLKTVDQLKEELINENFRLLYVGITRAKYALYPSFAVNMKRHGTFHSCVFFEYFNNISQ